MFTRSIFFEKDTFPNVFQILGGNFSGLRQIFSTTVFRTALVSRFFNRIYANFFRTSRKMFLPGLSELHSTCTQDCFCFHRKHLLWKKNSFPIIFRILDGDFSVFRQKFSSTVVKNALESRFLIGFMPTFFGLYAKIYWLICQNSTLRAHRIVFMGSIFFEKNIFPIVFHILGANFSGCRQKFSSTVVKNALDFRFLNRIYSNFFGVHAKIYWSVCQNFTLRVHRIVFHEKHLIWKKHFSICIPHFRPKFFSLLGKSFPAR